MLQLQLKNQIISLKTICTYKYQYILKLQNEFMRHKLFPKRIQDQNCKTVPPQE